jgi:hypothetical protein
MAIQYIEIPGLGSIPLEIPDFSGVDASSMYTPEAMAYTPSVYSPAADYMSAPEPVAGISTMFAPEAYERAGRFAGEGGGDIELSGLGRVGSAADVATTPNYLVRPTAGLDPTGLSFQTVGDQSGFQFVTNKGNAAGVDGKAVSTKGAAGTANPSGFVPYVEGATYRIRDEKGKDEILYTGVGEEGLRNVYALAQNLSATKGKKANWGVEMQLPGETSWHRVADDDPAKSFVNKALDVVGDAALGFVVGGPVGALAAAGLSAAGVNVTDIAVPMILAATPLGPVAGAGIGSFGASVAQGRSLEESFIRAGLSAVTAGAIEKIPGAKEALGSVTSSLGIDKAISSGLLPKMSSSLSSALTSPITGAGGEIVVQGLGSLPVSAAAAGIGSGVTADVIANAVANSASGQTAQQALEQAKLEQQFDQTLPQDTTAGEPPITVTGQTGATGSEVISGIGGGASTVSGAAQDQVQQPTEEDIVVQARVDEAANLITAGAGIGALTSAGFTQAEIDRAIAQVQQKEIVAEAQKAAGVDTTSPAIGGAAGTVTGGTAPETIGTKDIVAEGQQQDTGTPAAGIGGTTGGAAPETVGTEDIKSVGQKQTGVDTSTAGIGGGAGTVTGGDTASPVEEDGTIRVEGEKDTPTTAPSDLTKDTGTGETKTDEGVREEPPKDKDLTKDDGKGLSTKDYIRMALAAPQLLRGIGDLLGAGESNERFVAERSPLTYTALNRKQTISGGTGAAPAFDVFTYGQNVPGAQASEFTFFEPYALKAAPQTYTSATTVPIYTQADVDARNAAITNQYNAKAADFNAYQNALASQVAAGTMTPEAAAAAAQQYATGLGVTASAPAMAEGGEVDDDMVKHLVAYSQGGGHKGPGKVSGIGSGQEDLIPAWLSDGEYVWSAQDVADLGDGSTDEGVRRLDKMREMVRRNAGRKQVKKIAKPQPGLDKMLKAVGGPV